MIYQIGKPLGKWLLSSNPPSPLEFPGPLTPTPSEFPIPSVVGYGYFLDSQTQQPQVHQAQCEGNPTKI